MGAIRRSVPSWQKGLKRFSAARNHTTRLHPLLRQRRGGARRASPRPGDHPDHHRQHRDAGKARGLRAPPHRLAQRGLGHPGLRGLGAEGEGPAGGTGRALNRLVRLHRTGCRRGSGNPLRPGAGLLGPGSGQRGGGGGHRLAVRPHHGRRRFRPHHGAAQPRLPEGDREAWLHPARHHELRRLIPSLDDTDS